MSKTAYIIGSGQIGYAIARRFLHHGWAVSVAHRSSSIDLELTAAGARVVELDRNDVDALARWLAAGADVLVDTVAFHKAHAHQLLTFQNSIGSLCVISSASVYCDDAGRSLDESATTGFPEFPDPIKEDNRTVAPSDETYSTRKVALEQTLLQQSSIPVTILRPCAIYGIRTRHPREWWLVKRFLDGRLIVPLAFRGESRFHTSATVNIAELARVTAEAQFMGVLNAGDPRSLSVREITKVVSSTLNWNCEVVLLDDSPGDGSVGQTMWSVPKPFVLSTIKAGQLGYTPVATYEEAAPEYCRWLVDVGSKGDWRKTFSGLSPYPLDEVFDYAAEDRFLNAR